MIELKNEQYGKAKELVTSHNELSVFTVLEGLMEGKVHVDSAEHPQVLMIESSETTLLAGRADNDAFNQALTESLGFWEQVTPDNEEWRLKIPEVHPNKYIREYTRHRYIVTRETFTPIELSLPEGYVPEKIDLPELRKKSYKNADKIYKWAAEWGR